jgi:hypothetical protein
MNETAGGTSTFAPPADDGLSRLVREKLGERFFYALATAVREHETHTREHPLGVLRRDEALYRSLRRICGEL